MSTVCALPDAIICYTKDKEFGAAFFAQLLWEKGYYVS